MAIKEFFAELVDADIGKLHGTTEAEQIYADSVSTEELFNDQLPDVVIKRDGTDAVALDMVNGQEIARNDAVTGRGAYRTVQSAIDSLPASGGHIYVRSGTYSADNFDTWAGSGPLVQTDQNNLEISGDGNTTVFTIEDGATDSDDGAQIFDFGADSDQSGEVTDGLILRNFKIDGNQQTNGGNGDGNTIDKTKDGHNLNIKGKDVRVFNVTSNNSTGDGIELQEVQPANSPTEGALVWGCTFRDNWEQAIHAHGLSNSVFAFNYCDGEINNGVLSLYTQDIKNSKLLFFGNNFVNGTRFGAELSSSGGVYSEDIYFIRNIVANNGEEGILVKGDCRDLYIEGNWILNNAREGIAFDGSAVERYHAKYNVIALNDYHGVRVKIGGESGSNPVNGLWIEENYIYNNNRADGGYDGIYIRGLGNDFNDAQISRNDIYSDTTIVHDRGIFIDKGNALSATNDVLVENNWIVGHNNEAIRDEYPLAVRRKNYGADDYVSTVPQSMTPTAGDEYLDDGTNTGSGTRGKRVYAGGVWNDAWTL